MNRIRYCLISILLLSSCATHAPQKAQPYSRPADLIPQDFPNTASMNNESVQINWQSLFLDKNLQETIRLALANNRNLRVAAANIERASAQLALVNSARIPSLGISTSASASQTSGASANNSANQNFGASFGFSSFEIDAFGKISASSNAAQENLLSQTESIASLKTSIVSQTALGWLVVNADRQALESANKTFNAWQHTLKLISARKARGLSSELDETSVHLQLQQVEADILAIETRMNQNKSILFAIVGEPISDKLYLSNLPLEVSIAQIPTNLSSSILYNRPDILAAEHNLLASQANINAARAAFFPRINLSSGLGFATRDLSNLFSSGAFAYNLAANLSGSIFDSGANNANLNIATANQKIAQNQYENAIIAAFSEVWSALSVREKIDQRINLQAEIVRNAKSAVTLSEARFNSGIDSYLPLLLARRTLYTAEQNQIASSYLKAYNSVALYRALGADNSFKSK